MGRQKWEVQIIGKMGRKNFEGNLLTLILRVIDGNINKRKIKGILPYFDLEEWAEEKQ